MSDRVMQSVVLAATAITLCYPERSSAQEIELTRAQSLGYLDYSWSGEGNSSQMRLTITNRTEREWIIHVEVGTKLEPANYAAQSMTVIQDIHVRAHPHDQQTVEVSVNCLDINKEAPREADIDWVAEFVPPLRDFILCTDRIVDDEINDAPSDTRNMLDAMRPFIVQASLWKARGATMQQWVNFFEEYWHLKPEQASQMASSVDPAASSVVQQCPAF